VNDTHTSTSNLAARIARTTAAALFIPSKLIRRRSAKSVICCYCTIETSQHHSDCW
jgi:hypothetical protein